MDSKSALYQYPAEFPEQIQMLEKLDLLFPDIVHVQDLTTQKIIYINDRFTELLGYSKQDLADRGGNLHAILLSESLFNQRAARIEELITRQKQFVEYETLLLHKNQTERLFRTRVAVFRSDAEGNPLETISVSQDITESHLNYTKLLQQQEMHRITEQAFHFGSWEKNLTTGELICSDGLYEVMGHTRETFRKDCADYTSFFTFLDHRDDELVVRTVQEAIDTRQAFRLEHRVMTQEGQEKVLMVVGRPVVNEKGKVTHLVGSIADITLLRQYESALRQKIEELQRSNGELEQFAYAASHDLQEPLRKISAFISRLKQRLGTQEDEEVENYMRRTLQAIDRMRSLIDALLILSRVTRQGKSREIVPLNPIVEEILEDFDAQIAEKGAIIEWDELPEIYGVPVQMRQLFSNLIGNSLKFTDTMRPPIIRIAAQSLSLTQVRQKGLSTARKWVEITLQDNGIGFDPEYKERIFQVFQRLNGRSEFEGTGIGLALCKKIVEHEGGIILADSKPGEGARFTFCLPSAS
ncbi:sensor histidine kinase [Siphonobacter curvatus]|uniref:histidine kinase n=1 Tax=Siphonobacter curvatus TaxID=2094562 RepID=A0A2S7IMA6_9BACT|nr:ATP-binding protein [Siphonobacter curvatus]PQA58864.1 hypothetical protein C5O19_04175 [Siphonobacter curvatus]